jgi:hypothetical protein
MSSYKDDWEPDVLSGEVALKIKAAFPRQPHIEHEAGWGIWAIGLQKLRNGCKQLGIQANRSQETPKRISKCRIVLDDQDFGACLRVRVRFRSR